MRSRTLRLAMLGFLGLWFGVLLPVHVRGQIAPPGGPVASRCCDTAAARSAHPPSTTKTREQRSEPRHRAKPCAVCDFIAALDLPPPVMLAVPPPQRAREIQADVVPLRPVLSPRHTCSERGPPLA